MRLARLILALYVFVWFNVIVPIHTRGMVTLPGAAVASPMATMPCCAKTDAKSAKPDGSNPAPKSKSCAVCYVASTYTVPILYAFDLQPAAQVALAKVTAVSQIASRDYPTPYWPLGPPVLL